MEDRKEKLSDLEKKLDIDKKKHELAVLQEKLKDETVWSDWELGQSISQDASALQKELDDFFMLELLVEEGSYEEFDRLFGSLELKTFLSMPHDKGNALLSIHAGQGGTEAMDWASILLRMYLRFAEKNNWKTQILSSTDGEEAGIKTVTIEVYGKYAYGFLKNEQGSHRLVRLSPFNSDNLRQTSFALVEVVPIIDDSVDIEVKDEELEFDFFRAGGAGGQNVNKVSTAVRIRHLPSGIVVACQEERSQGKNKEKAMQMLKSKLYALELKRIEEEKKRLKGEHIAPAWGTQIRNYVLHPYKLVKDLRTDVESTNPDAVLDGDIEAFINAEIRI